jgi:hypothetical protein
MDRQIVYPGSIPLDTDLLSVQRNVLVALGYLAQATLGSNAVVDGLACLPSQPASMTVNVGPGSITQFGAVDVTAFGSLPAEPGEPLVRMGVNVNSASFALSAPLVPGQAINYLIEASLLEEDSTPVILPYFNALNPAQPFSGPAGAGNAQNTQRLQSVQLQLKAGAPGTSGSQPTPAVDAGWVGLYIITATYGQNTIGSGSISVLPAAPFISYKLPQLSPGTRNLRAFTPTTQGNWSVPSGTNAVRLRIWGGGGAGGGGFSGAGGGGAGGGYSEGFYAVAPGQNIAVTVGSGGAGSGTAGGASTFGSIASASGGLGGGNGAAGAGGVGGGSGGAGAGTGVLQTGLLGGDGLVLGAALLGGSGGASFGGAGALGVVAASLVNAGGRGGSSPGGGGGGGIGSGSGGAGGAGLVIVEW